MARVTDAEQIAVATAIHPLNTPLARARLEEWYKDPGSVEGLELARIEPAASALGLATEVAGSEQVALAECIWPIRHLNEVDSFHLVGQVTKSGNVQIMPRRSASPIGAAVADEIHRHNKTNPKYRKARARFERAEAVARLLIQFRMKHNFTQEQLARLMGTSTPTISRLESGTHVPSLTTLSRLAEAAGERLVIGFERPKGAAPRTGQTLVAL